MTVGRAALLGAATTALFVALAVAGFTLGRAHRTSASQATRAESSAERRSYAATLRAAELQARARGRQRGLHAGATAGVAAGRHAGRRAGERAAASAAAAAAVHTARPAAAPAGTRQGLDCPGGAVAAEGECPNENPFVSRNANGTCTDVTSNAQVPCSYLDITKDPNHPGGSP